MKILAVDASGKSCSAAILHDDTIVYNSLLNVGLTHSETFLPMIESALQSTSTKLSDLDAIAVTVGPGSFTGLKIGVSTVKGLAIENNISCIPVSTLESFSYGIPGNVNVVLDARRNMFYNAIFNNGTRICEDRQISAEELLEQLPNNCITCGDGALLFQQLCQSKVKIEINPYFDRINASQVGRVALRHFDLAISPELLVPNYIRPSQAEREYKNTVGGTL